MSYQEIGEIRNISALTVLDAMLGIWRRLGFKTRQQLVVWGVRMSLVDDGQANRCHEWRARACIATPFPDEQLLRGVWGLNADVGFRTRRTAIISLRR